MKPVRPIALGDIEEARTRIAGDGTADAAGQARSRAATGRRSVSSSKISSRPTPTRSAAPPMPSPRCPTGAGAGRVDDQRRQCRPGRRLCRARVGIPCSVVAIETAPQTKLDRMRALGATHRPGVLRGRRGKRPKAHAFEGIDGTFIHPFDNHDFIAGHGTMGLEILEDLPRRPHGHRRDRRRRADHRRRQRDQGAAART